MRIVLIAQALDLGCDVLQVTGTVDEVKVTARGWMSAMSNHYDADAYDAESGHRDPAAKPREMTDVEKRAYMESLLIAGAGGGVEIAAAEPVKLPIPGQE